MMRNTCFWAALVLHIAAMGRAKKKGGQKRERKERKELWYSQPPQTIPPLMCCESRRAARPSWFLNHFLQEGLSTCSRAGFGQGGNAVGPWEHLRLLSSLLELQQQRQKCQEARMGASMEGGREAGWICLFQLVDPLTVLKLMPSSLGRDGSEAKTQIKGHTFLQQAPDSARSRFSIFSTLTFWLCGQGWPLLGRSRCKVDPGQSSNNSH